MIIGGFVVSNQYNAPDRQLLRLFIVAISPVIREILELNNDVNLGFFLTVFENEVGTRAPNDKYNIKSLYKLFGD